MTLENSDSKQIAPESKIEGKVRLPDYIKSDPKLWFTIVETTFTANAITDDAKRMAHLYPSLPQDILIALSDIIGGAYEDKFARCRERVLSMFGTSNEQNIDKLLSAHTYTGKPSQILAEMRRLMGNGAISENYEAVVRRLWVRNIPESIRDLVTAVTVGKSLDESAKLADQLYDNRFSGTPTYNSAPFPTYSAASSVPFQPAPPQPSDPTVTQLQSDIAILQKAMADLTKAVTTLTIQQTAPPATAYAPPPTYSTCACSQSQDQNRSRQRYRSQSRGRNDRRDATPGPPRFYAEGKCRFHALYGSNARRCVEGCSVFDANLDIVRSGN